jgi:thiamine-phosphate pyrophosphorylase
VERTDGIPTHPHLKPLADCRLYAFVDASYLAGRDPGQITSELCAGGADIVQLRAKSWSPHEIQRLGEQLLPITRSAGVWLVINDHPEVALRIGAPACHLGQEDFFGPDGTRYPCLTPASTSIRFGLSSHAPDQARRALMAGAHYIAVGPVFGTGTKPEAKPVTLEYVRWAAHHVDVPWFAIGGITLENVESVLAAGATRICVVSAILRSRDIKAACREFKSKLED